LLWVVGIGLAYWWRGWQWALVVFIAVPLYVLLYGKDEASFIAGFEAGAHHGVRKALELTDADLAAIRELDYQFRRAELFQQSADKAALKRASPPK
jgi:hypothetical protein